MIKIQIPGYKTLLLKNLVADYNGTLAIDGKLIAGVGKALILLSGKLHIHIVTADTFGTVASAVKSIPCKLAVLPEKNQDTGKLQYIKKLGPEHTVCIGNGRNDRLMLKKAGLGIVLIQKEGAASESLLAADVVCTDILDALNLLKNPLRLKATLRV